MRADAAPEVATVREAVGVPEASGPRDRAIRWGAPPLYLGAIAVAYINNTPGPDTVGWQWVLQIALLPLVIAAVALRARLPYALPLLGLAGMVAGTSSVFMVGMLSVAIRRSGVLVWLLAAVGGAFAAIAIVQRDIAHGTTPTQIALAAVIVPLMFGILPTVIGGYIRAHRRLAASVAERAVRAEFERELAARQAVHADHERIAREMHDSLGHTLALVTMQAGALEVRAGDPEVAAAAEQIRSSARSGLVELRAVVRALGEDARRDPAPGLAAVPRLVEASRDAGAVVAFGDQLTDAAALPPSTGRIVYQVVQEALTNAHRHAPRAPVEIVLSGAPGTGIRIAVTNTLAPGGERGAGTGLESLRGRVEVLGGRLDARATHGRFELRVDLPWEASR